MRRIALLLALAPALAIAPASAQTAPGTAAAQVDIAFAPPLDATLRFRITKSKARSGQPAVTVSWIEETRFTRNNGGFVLHWRIDGDSLPPEMRHPSVAPLMAPFTGAPIAFDLDEYGTLLRVRDWDAVLPKILQIVETTVARFPGRAQGKEQTAQVTAQIRGIFERLDAESAVGVLMKNIAPVFNWGDMSMRVGEPLAESSEQPVPMLGGNILQHTRATMTALDPGKTARIELRTESDRESLRKLMLKVPEQFGAPDNPAAKARFAQEMAKIDQVTVVDTSVVVIDLPTGLPRTFENSRKANAASENQSEDLRIEWLR